MYNKEDLAGLLLAMQESPDMSPSSARHVRDASEDLEQNSSTTSASSCDEGTI